MKILRRGFSRKYEDLRLRINYVDVLVAIKEAFRYSELSSLLNISVLTLCKYYHGLTIPGKETSKRTLSKLLSKEVIKNFIHRLVRSKKYCSLV